MESFGPVFWLVMLGIAGLIALAYWSSNRSYITIREYERGVRFVRGAVKDVLGPGRHIFNPRTSEVKVVDIRRKVDTVEGQEVVTLDGVGLRVSLVIEYEVAEPQVLLTNTQLPERALYLAVQVALREVLSAGRIDELVERREQLAGEVLEKASARAAEYGFTLRSVGVRDIMFPGALKRIMGLVVEARKTAEAALERARGEQAAMRSLANTARLLDKNPALLQLRLLQEIGDSGGNTLVLKFGADGIVETEGLVLPRGS